jgi:DNA polymerase-3 subunit delta
LTIPKPKKETIDTWRKRVERGEVPKVLFLHGEDEGRILSFVEDVRHRCLQGAMPEFNQNLFDAPDTPFDRVLEAAETLPVLSDWRLVIVRNASSYGKEHWDSALRYFNDPSPTTCLVLRGEKPPSHQPVLKAIASHGAVLEFRPRSKREAGSWIADRATAEGKKLSGEAIGALLDRVGTREGELEVELQKLFAYVGANITIDEGDVREVAAEAKTHRIFDLTDAVAEHRTADALKILHRMLDDGTPPLSLMAMMARQVRLLFMVRESSRSKADSDRLRSLSLPPFLQDRLVKQCRGWDDPLLTRALNGLVLLDRALKSGAVRPEILLDRWVLDTAKKSEARKSGRR